MSETKGVAFGDVQVRKYPVILGCHPGCKDGLPVELAWTHASMESTPVDVYEYLRRKEKRKSRPRRLSQEYRREYLSSLGLYTNDDFIAVLLECLEIQRSRVQSAGSENSRFFLDDNFFQTSAAALFVGGTLKSVLKSTRALGDTSLSAAMKSSHAAVTAAVSASKATGNAIGASSKAIAKVSAGKAKTIVKVVSASAEKVRSHSVGRRRPSMGRGEFASPNDSDPEGSEVSDLRQRPSLTRLFSSQECIYAKGRDPMGTSRRPRARSRSRSRLLGTRRSSDTGEEVDEDVPRNLRALQIGQRRSRSIGRRIGVSSDGNGRRRIDHVKSKDSFASNSSLVRAVSRRFQSGGTTDDESSEDLNLCDFQPIATC